MHEQHGSAAAVARLLREIESLLKHPNVAIELGSRGINASIATLAVQGLAAYVDGNRARAYEDLSTAAEEIHSRMTRK
jgi:hypothetical protein